MIAMLCVQGSGSLAKILFQSFPVLTVSAMRLCFGAIILAIIFKIWTINFKVFVGKPFSAMVLH
jgi:inner membrane transporter RhtA